MSDLDELCAAVITIAQQNTMQKTAVLGKSNTHETEQTISSPATGFLPPFRGLRLLHSYNDHAIQKNSDLGHFSVCGHTSYNHTTR